MASPLVSIVMCTYNGALVLDEQIRSILDQDYDKFELVIVDDVSTDNSFQKLEQWAAQSPKIRLYQNEKNLGYNRNFEKAIGLAKGDFIAISDQDDIWMPEKISLQLAAFTSGGVLITHGMSVILENGKLQFKKRKLHYHYSGNDPRKLFFFNPVQGHDMMFRKELVASVLPIPEGIMYDWWIAVNAAAMGRIVSVPEVLVYQRIHQTNSFFGDTKSKRKTQPDLDQLLRVITKVRDLDSDDRQFLQTLLQFVERQSQPGAGFNLKFFTFLFSNRNIFFGHKRRLFPLFSYFKNSIKYAKVNFRGKGLSY